MIRISFLYCYQPCVISLKITTLSISSLRQHCATRIPSARFWMDVVSLENTVFWPDGHTTIPCPCLCLWAARWQSQKQTTSLSKPYHSSRLRHRIKQAFSIRPASPSARIGFPGNSYCNIGIEYSLTLYYEVTNMNREHDIMRIVLNRNRVTLQ
jgi:hypothetical protein